MRANYLICTGIMLSLAVPATSRAQEVNLANVSGDEALQEADERIVRMETILAQVSNLRDESHDVDRDLTRVRCINDKIAAIQGFLRLSTDSRQRLQEHVTRNDEEGIRHQYGLIVIASQRVSTLDTAASQCAGDILTFAGDTEQQASIDPLIPERDLTDADRASAELERLAPEDPLPEATPYQ